MNLLRKGIYLFIILCLAGSVYAQSGWNPQNCGTTQMLMSVYFTDTDNGWIAATFGEIYHTEDGGINWDLQESGIYVNLLSVYFHDVNTGWAVGQNGSVIHTIDGGENWNTQVSGTTEWLY